MDLRVLRKQWQGEFCRCSINVVGGKQCDGGVEGFKGRAPNGANWLKNVFESQWRSIQASIQATDAEDLDLDIFQAAAAVEIAGRMLDRLRNNPKTRSLGFVVLATTAHM
jgi:hypothetical protein